MRRKKGSLLFKFQKSHFYLYNVLNEGVWVRAPALKLFISIIISCSFDGTRLSRFYHFCFYAFKVFVSEFKRIFSTWDILNGKINVEVVYLWWLSFFCCFFFLSTFALCIHSHPTHSRTQFIFISVCRFFFFNSLYDTRKFSGTFVRNSILSIFNDGLNVCLNDRSRSLWFDS